MGYKISVLSPTIRPEGLAITRKCLGEQTFKDFEWLVEVGVPGKGHDLNAAYNCMLKRAKGELIVSLQDFIKVPPDYLEKWWNAYQTHPDTFMTAPVGKVDNLAFGGDITWDWRAWTENEKPEDYMNCRWQTWEIDSGAAPLKCLKQIGGFDEELDKYWSCDNVNVGCRADLEGYKFINYFRNPAIAYDHDAHIPHPFRDKFKPDFNNERMNAFREGLKVDYLHS